jgi:hypothetical protein
VINFTKDEDCIDHCDTNEIRRIAKRYFRVKDDSELIHRLGLKALPETRKPTTEFRNSIMRILNKSGSSITATFFDCDQFVWMKKQPFNISDCNLGTELIGNGETGSPVKNVFNSMSATNGIFAVLVSWKNTAGTKRWLRLAGFIGAKPQEKMQDRIYKITVVGDVENVNLEPDPNQDRITVIQ